jgi:hypothetical protein
MYGAPFFVADAPLPERLAACVAGFDPCCWEGVLIRVAFCVECCPGPFSSVLRREKQRAFDGFDVSRCWLFPRSGLSADIV